MGQITRQVAGRWRRTRETTMRGRERAASAWLARHRRAGLTAGLLAAAAVAWLAPLIGGPAGMPPGAVVWAQLASPLPRVVVIMDDTTQDGTAPGGFTTTNGYTGDWPVHLIQGGYAVAALSQATLAAQPALLAGAALVVVGEVASGDDRAIQVVRTSGLPVLNGSTRYVEPLAQGRLADPPHHTVYGTTVDIVPGDSPLAAGLAGALQLTNPGTSYEPTLYRNPIQAGGTVLATVSDAGQNLAVWSLGDRSVYFGFWWSADGRNHNPTYWALFDRSMLYLLGQDPLTVPIPTPPVPAASPTPVTTVGPTPAGPPGTPTPYAPPPTATAVPPGATPTRASALPEGSVFALAGTPHLWIVDEHGVLHWGGDTRALAGRRINWDSRTVAAPAQLAALPIGSPWLSLALVRVDGVVYQPKWETDQAAPQLVGLPPPEDAPRFGLSPGAAETLALDAADWEQRFRLPLPPRAAATPAHTPSLVAPRL